MCFANAKWRDPEFLNLFPEPRYHPMSASLHRRLLSITFVVAVFLYAVYELDAKGLREEEVLDLPKEGLYSIIGYQIHEQGAKTREVVSALYHKTTAAIPKPFRSWIPTDPALQGNVQPESLETEENTAQSNQIHHKYTGENEFPQHLPEYPLKVIVYGPMAKHAIVTQTFSVGSHCSFDLLNTKSILPNPNIREEKGFNDVPLKIPEYRTSIVSRLSGSTKGLYMSSKHVEGSSPLKEFAPDGLSSSTLVLDPVVSKQEQRTKTFLPWFGSSVYSNLNEEDCAHDQHATVPEMAPSERKCFSSVRVKLCGYHRSGSATQENEFHTSVKISLPKIYSNTTIYIGIQQVTPDEFNSCTKEQKASQDCDRLAATPTLVALKPYHQETLMAKGKISLANDYAPVHGGYVVDFTGRLLNGLSSTFSDHTDVARGGDGQSLKIVLSEVSYRRTKNRYSLFGLVGGVASILTALFGVLATLCDPKLDAETGEVVGHTAENEGNEDSDVGIELKDNPMASREDAGAFKSNVRAKKNGVEGKRHWKAVQDPKTHKVYYHHTGNGQVSWTKPNEDEIIH